MEVAYSMRRVRPFLLQLFSVLNSKEHKRMNAPEVFQPADSFDLVYLVPSAIFTDAGLQYSCLFLSEASKRYTQPTAVGKIWKYKSVANFA